MAFYDSASNKSLWRGIDYYKAGKAREFVKSVEGLHGTVDGSNGEVYDVTINLEHPKKSTCDCPFAEGRKVICKHMIALYFTGVPGSYAAFEEDMRKMEVQQRLEEERWQKETLKRIKKDVSEMSAKDVREKLVDILFQQVLDNHYRNDGWW